MAGSPPCAPIPSPEPPEPLGIGGGGDHPLRNEEHAELLNHLADVLGATFDTAGQPARRSTGVPHHAPTGAPERRRQRPGGPEHRGPEQPRRVQRVPGAAHPVRVVCANTQYAALRNHLSSWSIRHTRNAKAAVQAARDTLGLTFAFVEAFEAEAERMINTSPGDSQKRPCPRPKRAPVHQRHDDPSTTTTWPPTCRPSPVIGRRVQGRQPGIIEARHDSHQQTPPRPDPPAPPCRP